MLLLSLTGGAALSLLMLPGWERERISDAVLLLVADPRPPNAARLRHVFGEAYEIWVGSERRVRYRIYKDDSGEDRVVAVLRII